jgi:hypothetical protein
LYGQGAGGDDALGRHQGRGVAVDHEAVPLHEAEEELAGLVEGPGFDGGEQRPGAFVLAPSWRHAMAGKDAQALAQAGVTWSTAGRLCHGSRR